jgi:hypothetical protein
MDMEYLDSDNSAVDRESMIANVLAMYDGATDSQRARGAQWYRRMALVTHGHAARLGLSPENVAGVYAAWSINNGWRNNLRQARATLTGRQARGLKQSMRKAQACMAGSTIDAEVRNRKARKIRSFAANLAGDLDAVTVDRWALRVAYATDKGYVPKGTEYDAIAYAYVLAALLRDVQPAVMQAVTWVALREQAA